jgi:hypothetical protein
VKGVTAAIAERWGVTQRTVQRWQRAWGDEVCGDELKLAARVIKAPKASGPARAHAAEVLAAQRPADIAGTAADVRMDPAGAVGDLRDVMGRLQSHLAYVDGELAKAKAVGDPKDVLVWARPFREFASLAQSIRMTQAKLGIDAGELVSKADLEVLVHAWAGRAIVGLVGLRDALAPRLVGLGSTDEAARVLEPALLVESFVGPFRAAVHHAASAGLPEWVAGAVEVQAGGYLERGLK